MANKSQFKKPPLSPEQKLEREKQFLSFDKIPNSNNSNEIKKKTEKEPVKTIFIRAPESYKNDLEEIVNLTGISLNAVCLELLRPAIKKKLREIKEN